MASRGRYTVKATHIHSIVSHRVDPDNSQKLQYLLRWVSGSLSHPPLSWHTLDELGSVLHLLQLYISRLKAVDLKSAQAQAEQISNNKKRRRMCDDDHDSTQPTKSEDLPGSRETLPRVSYTARTSIYNATLQRKEGQLLAVACTTSTTQRMELRSLPTPPTITSILAANIRDAEAAIQNRYEARLQQLSPKVSYHNSVDRATPSLAFTFIDGYLLRPPCISRTESMMGCSSCRPNMGANRGCEYTRKCECLEFAAADLDKLTADLRSQYSALDFDQLAALDLPKRFPYYSSGPRTGCLVEFYLTERHPIYECNDSCACGPRCKNRNVQNGRRVPLEIFRTSDARGFGLRCLESLQRGQFIDVYRGEVISDEEASIRERRAGAGKASYLFSLDKFAGADVDGVPMLAEEDLYVVDGEHFGGPARFMNHSCAPNVQMHTVSYNKYDLFLYDLAFFACEDIAAGVELTFDYMDADEIDAGTADEDNKKRVPCLCGADRCRRYLWT